MALLSHCLFLSLELSFLVPRLYLNHCFKILRNNPWTDQLE